MKSKSLQVGCILVRIVCRKRNSFWVIDLMKINEICRFISKFRKLSLKLFRNIVIIITRQKNRKRGVLMYFETLKQLQSYVEQLKIEEKDQLMIMVGEDQRIH